MFGIAVVLSPVFACWSGERCAGKDSVPKERRDDEFDREMGERLKRRRGTVKKAKT